MSVLSDNLKKNENVIFEAKVHWATLIVPSILTLVTYGIGLIWLIPTIIRLFTTEISLSNKRLVGKVGLINTKSMDSPLNKINSVSVESKLLGKIFGYGTVIVNTASTTYYFKNILGANDFKNRIFTEMDNYEESKITEQAQAMAKAMKS